MPTKINVADYIGKKYGKLTILSQAPRKDKGNNTRFFVKCDCGNTTEVYYRMLISGNTKSCGCLAVEYHAKGTHGLRHHPLYQVWYNMVDRCTNPNRKDFYRYGGRGIKVCDEWKNDVIVFYNWAISNGWKKGLKTDRKDNEGNYSPENCHFVTPWMNSINRRDTAYVIHNGERIAIALLAKNHNISRQLVKRRVKNGWSIEKALSEKPRQWKLST